MQQSPQGQPEQVRPQQSPQARPEQVRPQQSRQARPEQAQPQQPPQGQPEQPPQGRQQPSQSAGGGQRSASVDPGLEFGGEARHGHDSSHVGARKTFGEPGGEARKQQAGSGGDPEHWRTRFQEYPAGGEGHEQYGHGHRHGDGPSDSPIGQPTGGGRR